MNDKEKQLFNELKELIAFKSNFINLRDIVHGSAPPCIPYIGLFLTDLTFIDEGNSDLIKGKINFLKRSSMANKIKSIQNYQQMGYKFASIPILQSILLKPKIFDSDYLYNLSLFREPR